jgi:hypothetical protein
MRSDVEYSKSCFAPIPYMTSPIGKMESKLDPTTSNQLDDIPTRIRRAKAFLQENPDELAVTAARI